MGLLQVSTVSGGSWTSPSSAMSRSGRSKGEPVVERLGREARDSRSPSDTGSHWKRLGLEKGMPVGKSMS